MIPNRERRVSKSEGRRWNYLAVKKPLALLKEVTSKDHGNFYCLCCFDSFATKNKFELHKRKCENKDFCNIIMHSEDTTISKFNQYQKSDKAPSIAYADLECIVENTDECKNNPKNLSTTKLSEHIPLGFSMSIISSIRSIENKRDVYRGNDCLDKSLEFL